MLASGSPAKTAMTSGQLTLGIVSKIVSISSQTGWPDLGTSLAMGPLSLNRAKSVRNYIVQSWIDGVCAYDATTLSIYP